MVSHCEENHQVGQLNNKRENGIGPMLARLNVNEKLSTSTLGCHTPRVPHVTNDESPNAHPSHNVNDITSHSRT